MALAETTVTTSDVTSDANFRAWGLAVRTALTDAGIIRTTDTGQIDFATVTSPIASAFGGYDIFRFPDSTDQTNFPVFFKLEYGKGTVISRQALRITVGTSSNGSGTIGGSADAAQTITAGVTPTGSAYLGASYFDGGLMLHSPLGTAEDSRTSFLIERIKRRADGVTTAGIQLLTWISSTATPNIQRLFNVSWGAGVISTIIATPSTNSRMVLGGFFQSDLASAVLRSLAFARTTLISSGDAGAITAEDATSLSYKRPATVSTQIFSTVTHDLLLRSA